MSFRDDCGSVHVGVGLRSSLKLLPFWLSIWDCVIKATNVAGFSGRIFAIGTPPYVCGTRREMRYFRMVTITRIRVSE